MRAAAHTRPAVALTIAALIAALVVGGCPSPSEPTIEDQGTIGSAGSYKFDYYLTAQPAQQQMQSNNIPTVIEDRGDVLVLDLTSWPAGWAIGDLILVRMPTDVVEYKRLLMRFQLDDGRLAVGVADAGLLEAIADGELTVEGDASQTVRVPGSAGGSEKLIQVIDFTDAMSFYIVNKTDVTLFTTADDEDDSDDGSADVTLQFDELSLQATPEVTVKLEVDKPFSLTDLGGWVLDLSASAVDITSDLMADLDGYVFQDDDGTVVTQVSSGGADLIIAGILASKDVAEKLDAINQALSDPSRIKEAEVIVQGDLTGTIKLSVTASASYSKDAPEQEIATVLVPISGPVPIFLQFDVVGIASVDFDGQVQVTTGADVTIPFYAGVSIKDGVVQDLTKPSGSPTFTFTEPDFAGTEAQLSASAGVQIESGITLAKLIAATVDPTAEIVFDTTAAVTGTTDAGCLDLTWDVYGRSTAELELEFGIPGLDATKRWDTPLEYTLLQGESPMGTYQTCWGATLEADAGPEKAVMPGSSATLEGSATGGDGNYSYSWSPAGGLSATDIATPTASPTATTTYTLTVTDGLGQTDTDTATITIIPDSVDPDAVETFGEVSSETGGELKVCDPAVVEDFSDCLRSLAQDAIDGPVDVVFVIDATASMSDDIESVKAQATETVDEIITLAGGDARFAIVLFLDDTTGDPYISKLELDFTDDRDTVVNAIRGIELGSGGDIPEAHYDGLALAFELEFRDGVDHVAFLITDAEPKDPSPGGALTASDVVDRATDAGVELSIWSLIVPTTGF